MSKAFDSVNHEILLNKLKAIGLSPSAVSWFRSYLSHRFQAVRINSTLSDALPVAYGVMEYLKAASSALYYLIFM
jgi:hypothetical protein